MTMAALNLPDPPEAAGVERRRHIRKALRVTAQLLLPHRPPLEVRTTDISVGGIGLVAPANPPPGLRCAIRVAVPLRPWGSAVVQSETQVVYAVLGRGQDGFLIGLQFIALPAAARDAIRQFVAG